MSPLTQGLNYRSACDNQTSERSVGRTCVVQHDETRLVTFHLHRLRRQGIDDLNELTTSENLGTGCRTVRRHPLYRRVQVGRHCAHYVSGKTDSLTFSGRYVSDTD